MAIDSEAEGLLEGVQDGRARDWSFAGRRRFKGVEGEVKVYRVRMARLTPP